MKSRRLIAAPASRPGIVATSLCAQEEISRADSKKKSIRPPASARATDTCAAAAASRWSAMAGKRGAGRQGRSVFRRWRPEWPESSRSGSRAGWRFCCGRRPRRLLQGCTWRPGYPFPMADRVWLRSLIKGVRRGSLRGRKRAATNPGILDDKEAQAVW